MKRLLADAELEKLSSSIALHMGLSFPSTKWKSLEQAFCTAAMVMGFKSQLECVGWFMSAPPSQELFESMACYLTIGETYFLREACSFEALEQQIIPEIIRKRHGKDQCLRIWSSGCATGEEPYSIAIVLYRMRAVLCDWDISILATDINPHALRKATAGIYTHWSFRNTPTGFKENYFTETEAGHFELLPAIKEMVTFSSFNLAEECYPSPNSIDIIFCRNVLMYFAPQLIKKVVAQYHHCLLDGGWLFVSSCETSSPTFPGFEPINFPDAILYQKVSYRVLAKPKSTRYIQTTHSSPPPPPPVQAAPAPSLLWHQSRHAEISDYQKALTLYEHGAYRDASDMLVVLLDLDKENTEALTLQCRIYANEGRLVEALEMSELALTADKLSSELHYLRAVILLEQGMNDEASAALKKALYLDQDLVMAHFTLANLEQRKGKVKESQRHFNAALSLLGRYRREDVIPESGGIIAGKLTEIIRTTTAWSL